ncbi:hypothetical protein LOZ58_003088 [Ophidiomyces ophidiicola]|nr:hypothetical protein LOZ58_003088 [Ophidiomyces ophidiicola]
MGNNKQRKSKSGAKPKQDLDSRAHNTLPETKKELNETTTTSQPEESVSAESIEDTTSVNHPNHQQQQQQQPQIPPHSTPTLPSTQQHHQAQHQNQPSTASPEDSFTPAPVPPPAPQQQLPLPYSTTTTTTTTTSKDLRQSSHYLPPPPQHYQATPSAPHNLSHPPGYIQNPVTTRTPTSGAAAAAGGGHWSWSDAPNLSGGRYVYSPAAGTEKASREAHKYDDGGGGYGDGDWGGGLGWMWEGVKGWAGTVGERLVEVEEGVWRWVNSRT